MRAKYFWQFWVWWNSAPALAPLTSHVLLLFSTIITFLSSDRSSLHFEGLLPTRPHPENCFALFTQCHITKLVAFNRYIHHHQSNSGNSLNKQTEKCNNVSPRKVVNQSQKSERKGTRQITCIWLLTVTKHHHHRYNLVSQARWFGRTQLKQPKTSKMALFNIHPFGKHQFSKMIESDNFWKISFPL